MPRNREEVIQRAFQIDDYGRLNSPGIERKTGVVPTQVRLPDAQDMAKLSDYELVDLIRRYGIFEDLNKMKAGFQSAYVNRLKSLNEFNAAAAMDSMFEAEPGRSLLQTARRVQEEYTTAMAIDGKEDQLLIRMPEDYDPDLLCENCANLAGTIGTHAQHSEIGLPGADSCLGGDSCRCTLVAID